MLEVPTEMDNFGICLRTCAQKEERLHGKNPRERVYHQKSLGDGYLEVWSYWVSLGSIS